MIADVESILKVCGIGTYLHIGCGKSSLVFDLLKRSIDAFGLDASDSIISHNAEHAPGRFFQGTLIDYPFKANAFDTLVIGSELLHISTEELHIALKALFQMTKRNLVLYFPSETGHSIPQQRVESNRLFWEKIAIDAGFRHHPRSMLVNHYDQLEQERMGQLTFFERIPDAALDAFPLAWLLANRDLHMDMLREAGRRSDAHVSRYIYAATKIRGGDTVLDAACGLGYGTAVLAACSTGANFIGVDIDPDSITYATANFAAVDKTLSYKACDITNLSFLPNHSIDVIVSFETIEHVENYDALLKELRRVLKPNGRIIGSVPNLWCDDTGKDPNPYHFHVFDWNKLQQAVSQYFIIDERLAQNAGGGFKLWNSKRAMWTVPLALNESVDTEWWIFSACADPQSAQSIPYKHHLQKEGSPLPNVIAFEKYYDNPWIYKVMVQLGDRLADEHVLINFCAEIANTARQGSADQGAALCVLAHQTLESNDITVEVVTKLVNAINAFDQAYDRENVHAYRWAISLYYVAAKLLLAIGQRQDALNTFISCAEMDSLRFTPILATKTISARMYAGLLLVGNNALDEAADQFKQGVKEAHRVLQGNWDSILGHFDEPFSFGLTEAAEILDLASQCSQALDLLRRETIIPGSFWDRIHLKRFGIVEWNKNLEVENKTLRDTISRFKRQEIIA